MHSSATSDCQGELVTWQDGRASEARTVTNSGRFDVREDLVFMPVDQVSDLVDVGRRETVGVGLVVGQLGVDVVVDVPLLGRSRSDDKFRRFGHGGKPHDVFQSGGTTEGEVLELTQEVASLLSLLLELVRAVNLLDVLLESL